MITWHMFCKSVSECCYNQSHFNGFLCKEMECLYSIDKTQCRCFRRLDYSTQYNIHLVLQAFKIHWLVSMSRFMQVVLIVCGQQRISWTVLIIQIQIPKLMFLPLTILVQLLLHTWSRKFEAKDPQITRKTCWKNPVPIPKKNIGSYLNPTTNRIEPQRYTDIVEEDEIRGDILMDVMEEKLKMNFLHHICISSRYDMVEITKNTVVFMTTTLPIWMS